MAVRPPLALPTEESPAGDLARQLVQLVGPAVQAPDGSAAAADALTWGEALDAVRETLSTAADQIFVSTATDMLAEHEYLLGLAVRNDLTDEARQTRLVAKKRANFAGTPTDILTAVRTYDAAIDLYENAAADVAGIDPRGVFVWALTVPLDTWSNDRIRAELEAIIAQMKPAHTQGNVLVGLGFLTDDDDSLVDRDGLDA